MAAVTFTIEPDGGLSDRRVYAGCVVAVSHRASLPLFWQYRTAGDGAPTVSAGDDADGLAALALGAAVLIYLCGRGVCRCFGDTAAEAISRSVRRDSFDPGNALPGAAAGDCSITGV